MNIKLIKTVNINIDLIKEKDKLIKELNDILTGNNFDFKNNKLQLIQKLVKDIETNNL